MRYSAVAFLMILTTMFLSGCGTERVASVEDKGASYYGHVSALSYRPMTPKITPVQSAYTMPQQAAVVETRELAAPATAMKPVAQNSVRLTSLAPARWQWPVNGKVIQNFGQQRDGIASEGICIAATEGDPIRAAQAGEVAFVGSNIRDYGNIVILRHGDGALSSYAHARSVSVAKGDKVNAGSVIAYVGKSGSAKTPQLHFAVREGDRAVDPLGKLPQNIASN